MLIQQDGGDQVAGDDEEHPYANSGIRFEKQGTVTLIRQMSGDVLQVGQGALYPCLHKLEQNGWISAEWAMSENNRRARFYRLTASGRKQLAAEQENWRKITGAVALVLDFQPS